MIRTKVPKRRLTQHAAFLVVVLASVPSMAFVSETRFIIDSGSTYTYFGARGDTSGCGNDCVFDISGAFTIVEQSDSSTAVFGELDLKLTGNEEADLSSFWLLNADGIEQWLSQRMLVVGADVDCEGACANYVSEIAPDALNVGLSGDGVDNWDRVWITRGFDNRAIDGAAISFKVSASVIPEPLSLGLVATVVASLGVVCRRVKPSLVPCDASTH